MALYAPFNIDARSPAMQLLPGQVRDGAENAKSTVLLQGETGTGKEFLARVIHCNSPRASGPFVAVNCTAIPKELFESELFGHERDAFTGAHQRKRGLLEKAEGGTLFLDEIGELDPAMQAKLLQVLDSREFRRVGGTRLHRVDVRIVAATNKSMPREVAAGRFREDLYYRLNVVNILVPPLRERREDIPVLAEHFLARFQASAGERKTLWSDALQSLIEYPWPGNVRELSNIIERLIILTLGGVIGSDALPANIPVPRVPVSRRRRRARSRSQRWSGYTSLESCARRAGRRCWRPASWRST